MAGRKDRHNIDAFIAAVGLRPLDHATLASWLAVEGVPGINGGKWSLGAKPGHSRTTTIPATVVGVGVSHEIFAEMCTLSLFAFHLF